MKTDENSGTSRLKIAVIGSKNVGKSALTVRYLTKRFIGEYRSNADLLYKQTVNVGGHPQDVEIVDVCCEEASPQAMVPEEPLRWADACVVTYSVTDRASMAYAGRVLELLVTLQSRRTATALPVNLVANKADLEHMRQVTEIDGRKLAVQNNCHFYEVSVADNSKSVYESFDNLISECRQKNLSNSNSSSSSGKMRKFSVTRMLGTLINGGRTSPPHQPVTQSGTVVECRKSDLYKSKVAMKRRNNVMVTASL